MNNSANYNTSAIPKMDVTRTMLIGAMATTLAISPCAKNINESLSQNFIEATINESISNNYNFTISTSGATHQGVNNVLDYYTKSIFGEMRNAIDEEIESVYEYMIKTSKKTGVNIFDLC